MKHWKERFEIYDRARIHLILSDNISLDQLKFKDIANPDDLGHYCGFATWEWPNYYLFLHEASLNKRTIAHEIFHITLALMRDVGVKCRQENDEAMAYMNDWLTGWVYGKLRGRKIPTNKRYVKL